MQELALHFNLMILYNEILYLFIYVSSSYFLFR